VRVEAKQSKARSRPGCIGEGRKGDEETVIAELQKDSRKPRRQTTRSERNWQTVMDEKVKRERESWI
jgi:hypothetical protein